MSIHFSLYNSFPLNIFADTITDKANAANANINITGIVIFDKTSMIIVVFALAINNGNGKQNRYDQIWTESD